jgi:hypothetical protein
MSQARNEHRFRIYAIPDHSMIAFLNAWRGAAEYHVFPKFDGLPEDAEAVYVQHNFSAMQVEVIVASMEFDPVAPGLVPPCQLYGWELVRLPAKSERLDVRVRLDV